jgi:hypothetical protein
MQGLNGQDARSTTIEFLGFLGIGVNFPRTTNSPAGV